MRVGSASTRFVIVIINVSYINDNHSYRFTMIRYEKRTHKHRISPNDLRKVNYKVRYGIVNNHVKCYEDEGL